MRVAKALRIAVLLVGHVTKDGRARRPARARAPRRLRAAVRGRARAHLPHRARDQEPLRLDQRGRRVRDARPRPGRGARRLGAVRRRGHPRAGQRRAVRDGGLAAAARRGPGAGLALGAGAAAARRVRVSTATGWRSCWPCSAATPASASAPPTCSSTSSAACASTSPAPTSRSRWRWPARRKRVALVGAGGAAARVLRRARADRRAAHGRPRRPPARRGGEVRPRTGGRAGRAPDLRAALQRALRSDRSALASVRARLVRPMHARVGRRVIRAFQAQGVGRAADSSPAKIGLHAVSFRGRAQRGARVSTGVPDGEGARDGRARNRAAGGHRQHPATPTPAV